MSLESGIYTALSSLVGGRVFPDVAPTDTTRPYITYQQIGGDAPWFIGRALPSKRNGVVQVNVWAATRSSAASIAVQAEAALIAATAFDAEPMGAFVSDYDENLLVYGTRQDFSVWADR